MLKKLLKYDFIKIYKFIGTFYILGTLFALISRFFISIQDSALIWFIFGQVFVGATWAMAVSGLINSAIRACIGFLRGLFGDECYLYRTLPIKTRTIFIEKLIVGMTVIFTSLVMATIEIVIAYFPFNEIDGILDLINNTIGTGKTLAAIFLFLIFFIEILAVYSAGTAGIVFGHKRTSKKNGFSVIYGFLFYIFIQAFNVGAVLVIGIFDKNIMKLFSNETNSISPEVIKEAAISVFVAYIISTLILQYTSWRAVKKGIDID